MIPLIGYDDGIFTLENHVFSYIFRAGKHGQLEQLHFGSRLTAGDAEAMACRPGQGWGSSVQYDADGTCLDVLALNWSGSGRGDYRESPLQWSLGASDFTYQSHRIVDGCVLMSGGLSQAQDGIQTLEITMTDPRGAKLLLMFTLFDTALTRRTVLVNESEQNIAVNKLMSFSIDLFGSYEMTTFDGGWIAEMRPTKTEVGMAAVTHGSTTGFSSNRHQPGFLLSEPDCTEEHGRIYGFNLIYSGNHYASCQRSLQGLTRVMQGIHPDSFEWVLAPGECFETPEAVLSVFCAAYLLWDISYGINDIAYWTLLPAMTTDQKQRESCGAFSRICASVGMYIVMLAWQPVTEAMGNTTGAWMLVAIVVSVLYLGFLCFTLFGVKENRQFKDTEEKITLKDMWRALAGNDQLMWTALAMALFMVGYSATVGFAVDYMKYVFGNVDLYVVLVGVCGVAQLSTLTAYPLIAKHFNLRQLYTIATAMVVAGYLVFFIAEISIILVALGAVLVFVGQAMIQMLMLMFLADSVEYGQWKLGRRSESVTFSVQPFVNKIGGAISTAIVSLTLVISGIKVGDTSAASIDLGGQLILKAAMFVIPLIFIVAGYIIYLKKFKIDEQFYAQILKDLEQREQVGQ